MGGISLQLGSVSPGTAGFTLDLRPAISKKSSPSPSVAVRYRSSGGESGAKNAGEKKKRSKSRERAAAISIHDVRRLLLMISLSTRTPRTNPITPLDWCNNERIFPYFLTPSAIPSATFSIRWNCATGEILREGEARTDKQARKGKTGTERRQEVSEEGIAESHRESRTLRVTRYSTGGKKSETDRWDRRSVAEGWWGVERMERRKSRKRENL